jgi:hypothetical protein
VARVAAVLAVLVALGTWAAKVLSRRRARGTPSPRANSPRTNDKWSPLAIEAFDNRIEIYTGSIGHAAGRDDQSRG